MFMIDGAKFERVCVSVLLEQEPWRLMGQNHCKRTEWPPAKQELICDRPISTMTKQKRNPILILTADVACLLPLPLTWVFIGWNIDSQRRTTCTGCPTATLIFIIPLSRIEKIQIDKSRYNSNNRVILLTFYERQRVLTAL